MGEAMIHGGKPVELLDKFIMIRVTSTQLSHIRGRAAQQGRPVANYIRRVLKLDYLYFGRRLRAGEDAQVPEAIHQDS